MKWIVVRHAESNWNKKGIFQGQRNPQLSPNGLIQASKIHLGLNNYFIDHIYSSDLKRAKKTATIINSYLNCSFETTTNIREIGFGIWEGLKPQELKLKFPYEYHKWISKGLILDKIQGSESLDMLTTRLINFISEVRLRHSEDSTILLVSHGGTIRLLAKMLLGIPVDEPISFTTNNAGISIIESNLSKPNARPFLEMWNQITHLSN